MQHGGGWYFYVKPGGWWVGKGPAVRDELHEEILYHIYSCFMVGNLSNAFSVYVAAINISISL